MTAVSWVVRAGPNESGNTLGYSSACENLRAGLLENGWRDDPDAKVAVHFCFPLRYKRVPGAFNVLFSMFENGNDDRALSTVFKPALDDADLVVVPSRFCEEMFRRYTDTPIEVCPLGINPELFPYRRRRYRPAKGPFVWLYLGAPNQRKYTILPELHEHFIAHPEMRGTQLLYVKTTGLDLEQFPGGLGELRKVARIIESPIGPVFKGKGFILDARKLPAESLHQIYYLGGAFLFLHCGEGYGQTGLEAMATGCPLVVSDYSGTQEYADATNAYPVRMVDVKLDLEPDPGSPDAPCVYEGPWPDARHALDQMHAIISDYDEALRRARRGAERAKVISWRAAGNRLSGLLSGYLG